MSLTAIGVVLGCLGFLIMIVGVVGFSPRVENEDFIVPRRVRRVQRRTQKPRRKAA